MKTFTANWPPLQRHTNVQFLRKRFGHTGLHRKKMRKVDSKCQMRRLMQLTYKIFDRMSLMRKLQADRMKVEFENGGTIAPGITGYVEPYRHEIIIMSNPVDTRSWIREYISNRDRDIIFHGPLPLQDPAPINIHALGKSFEKTADVMGRLEYHAKHSADFINLLSSKLTKHKNDLQKNNAQAQAHGDQI